MKAFLVGGAVRDSLMGLPVNDRDWVVVGATHQDMVDRGFEQVGQSFPVFLHPDTREEWALARTERKTGVGYSGFDVDTSGVTLEEDLARRDLTINAVAWDPETDEYFDPFGGVNDVKNKVLRHVSDAFAEDPLRVVRLARFYARYTDFSVALDTFDMASRVVLSGEMDSLPDERFVKEFEKVVNDAGSDFGRFVEMLHMLGVFQHVKFFKKTFSHRLLVHVRMMGEHVAAMKDAGLGSDTTAVLAAAFSAATDDGSALRVFGGDVRDTFEAIKAFVATDSAHPSVTLNATATDVVNTLKKVRSTRGLSVHADRALTVLRVLDKAHGWKMSFRARSWRKFAEVTANVDVAPLVERFEGKALGEQVHKAMVAAVEAVMKG